MFELTLIYALSFSYIAKSDLTDSTELSVSMASLDNMSISEKSGKFAFSDRENLNEEAPNKGFDEAMETLATFWIPLKPHAINSCFEIAYLLPND